MKLIKSAVAALLFGLMFSSQASVILILAANSPTSNDIDVGAIDTYLDSTNDLSASSSGCSDNSSPNSELCWANWSQNAAYTYYGKTGKVSAYKTNTTDVIAFELSEGPGTYLVKNSTWWGLFTNLANVNWGVIDTSVNNFNGSNLDWKDMEISHVSEYDGDGSGGGPQEVPAPASLLLLSISLLGLVGFRRFKKSVIKWRFS